MKLEWRTEKRKVKDLKLFEGNPRQMSEKQAENLLTSLRKFNLVEIPAIDQKNRVIAGNMRVVALQKLGRENEEIPVRVPSRPLTEEEAREYLIRSNKNIGSWDYDLLANWDESLLTDAGFTDDELDQVFQLDIGDADEIPEIPKKAKSKLGEIYQLGRHRLMCADCTIKENVERLMNGEKADMVFTDPPYGINIIKNKTIGGGGVYGGRKNLGSIRGRGIIKANFYKPIYGDDKYFNPSFLFDYSKKLLIFGANNFAKKLPESRGWFCWDKLDGLEGTTKNFSDIELGWTSFNKPARLFRHRWQGLQKGSEWKEKRCHPTQKPVQLMIDLLSYYAKDLNIILDPFGGSGSTLIACEQTNRKCYMMEIDPRYVDVIIERFEKFTGNTVRKEKG